jgi:hypothetical protein
MAKKKSISKTQSNPMDVKGVEWRMLRECASPMPDFENLAGLVRKVDWPKLLRTAEHHNVLGHVATRLYELADDSVPDGIRQFLRERHREQVCASLRMSAELFRLMDRFTAAGVEAIAIKGPVLAAQAYGDPAARSYNDLDLLVRQRDIRRATEMMIDEGYQPQVPLAALATGKIPGQFLFQRSEAQLIVEMHNENTLRYFPRRLPIEKVFDRRINVLIHERNVPALSVEDSLVLICIHGAKHFWGRLMWVADVAGLLARQPEINWEQSAAAASEVRAEHMLHAGLQLAAELLNAPLPVQIAEKVRSDSAAMQITKQVLNWLPQAEEHEPALLQRALFRMCMRGGILAASGYLLRLSLSPTEDDWSEGPADKRHWVLDSLRRPLRLARKYGRKR